MSILFEDYENVFVRLGKNDLMTKKNDSNSYIVFLDRIGIKDLPKVGGKNASLGEMIQNLEEKKIKVPNGFAVTVDAFDAFIEENDLKGKIEKTKTRPPRIT